MGRIKEPPGFVAGFQQTIALIQQAQDKGACWRGLSARIGYLVRAHLPWSSLTTYLFPEDIKQPFIKSYGEE